MGMVSMKLQSSFVETTLLNGCWSLALLPVCRATFLENISRELPLNTRNFTYNFGFIIYNRI